MQHVRDKDRDRVRILAQIDGNSIDHDWHEGTTSSARKDHIDKSISKGSARADLSKDFASMKIGVAKHAHVFLWWNRDNGRKDESLFTPS